MRGTTFAFIQARMGSQRLPGKVMKKLNGIPVIAHVVERLRRSQFINDIVVLTSTCPSNDAMVVFLEEFGVNVFRGQEDNVFQRFVDAAGRFPADNILRITADTPFVEPALCDKLIETYYSSEGDYAYLDESYAEGVDCEIMSAEALMKAKALVSKPSEFEHVTQVFFNHPNHFSIEPISNVTDDSHYRFTLDSQEDWEVVQAIAKTEGNDSLAIDYFQIKMFLDTHPEVRRINESTIRNEGLLLSLEAERNINEII